MKMKLIAAAIALAASASAQALTIDLFGDSDSVSAIGAGASVTGSAIALTAANTDLTNATRTNTANAGPATGSKEDVDVVANVLAISNNTFSNGTAKVVYNFDSEDFAAASSAILLKVLAIDLGVMVNITANGVSSSGFQAFTGPGTFFKLYSTFSDPTQFTHVTQLELDFKGETAWDGQFQLLASNNPPSVPEPASMLLVGLGLLGIGAIRRRTKNS